MEHIADETAANRLYLRGLAIRYERHPGKWLPIFWHLALRGHTGAMIELADWFSNEGSADLFGTPADAFSAAGLYRRAYRKGDARAAQHMAMRSFNWNDMAGYRHWLAQGVKAGDREAGQERRYFETRLWHALARKVGRLRPKQKRDNFR
ncbi:hypothetical protein [uncultured Sphingomonas sp.]|uniref:hypothetical protein n=1 Tax=uncultured Sphingomonas sp. TaxID=158754 RepID=UPI0025EBCCAC|nr:hypothetical protein [uncultured Sphingomonas sp.]